MLRELQPKLREVETLFDKSVNSLRYFYKEDLKGFASKRNDPPKPLSHFLSIMTTVELDSFYQFHKKPDQQLKERIGQLELFFKGAFAEWNINDDKTSSDFDIYVNCVGICSLASLIKKIGANNLDKDLEGNIKYKINIIIRQILDNYLPGITKKSQDYPKYHPMFIYWVKRALLEISESLISFLSEADKGEIENFILQKSPESIRLHAFILNQVSYYIAMCSAIPENEEDAIRLGFHLHSLKLFGGFDNDVLLEHGIDLVFSILINKDKTPRIHPIFRDKKTNIHASPIDLIILLSESHIVKNNFDKYIGYYDHAFKWVLTTKRQFGEFTLWMIEPWRGVSEPEAWLNCIRLRFLWFYKFFLKERIKVLLFDKYNASKAEPKVTWNEIKFDDPLFARQLENLIESVNNNKANSKKYNKCSVLLFGPPGTAKTTIARALAYQLKFPFIIISPHYFAENGMDGIIKSAREIFDELKILDDCLVLFDELDELVTKRNAEFEKIGKFITTSMLPWFQDLHDKGDIIFVATTNHISQFDPAIKRPGRFDYVLPVGPPSDNYVSILLKKFLGDAHSEDISQFILKGIKNNPYEKDGKQTLEEWRPTIGEIKTICEIVVFKQLSQENDIINIVKKIHENPLISFEDNGVFKSNKLTFTFPPYIN